MARLKISRLDRDRSNHALGRDNAIHGGIMARILNTRHCSDRGTVPIEPLMARTLDSRHTRSGFNLVRLKGHANFGGLMARYYFSRHKNSRTNPVPGMGNLGPEAINPISEVGNFVPDARNPIPALTTPARRDGSIKSRAGNLSARSGNGAVAPEPFQNPLPNAARGHATCRFQGRKRCL
jgi:hypothetical protein